MKKILFDTTYFLPVVGIKIEGYDLLVVQKLLSSNSYQIQLSEISLFELAAKGAKLAIETTLTYQEILRGIDTLRHDNRVTIQSWTKNPTILELAFTFRLFHADFIDCLILATAVCSSEILATYDSEMYKRLFEQKKVLTIINTINQDFSFWFEDLAKEPISLKN